jgi:ribonuclease HI
VVGVGVIFDSNGKEEIFNVWGIGNIINNQVEVLALWKGVWNMMNKGVKKMLVVGDSMIVIQQMISKPLPKEPHLYIMIDRTQKLLEGFEAVQFFHTLQGLNSLANAMANKACTLSIGKV